MFNLFIAGPAQEGPFAGSPNRPERQNATLIRPKVPNRQPIPPEVPPEFTEDYREACEILAESPKASAALSRRCLQFILREKAGVNKGNLKQEIDEVILTGNLTAEIADSLHTQHHQGTGEIVPAEPGEAEWCLEVIEMLFDFYFVRPADIQKRQRAWEQKRIASRGK